MACKGTPGLTGFHLIMAVVDFAAVRTLHLSNSRASVGELCMCVVARCCAKMCAGKLSDR
jgi:hypothetical protein